MTLIVSNIHLESTGNVAVRKDESNDSIQIKTSSANLHINSSAIYNELFIANSSSIYNANGFQFTYEMNDEFFVSAGDQPANTAPFGSILTSSQYTTLPSMFIEAAPSANFVDFESFPSRTITTSNSSLYHIFKIAAGNNKYVAILGDQRQFSTSTDLITWTDGTFGNGAAMYDVAYGNGVFVAVGASGNSTANFIAIQSSVDGITWTSRTVPENTSGTLSGVTVAYGAGRFVAGSIQDTVSARPLRISTNGTTWTNNNITALSGTYGVDSINFSDGLFTAILTLDPVAWTFGRRGGNNFSYSTDGLTWTARTNLVGTNSMLTSVYGNGIFMVAGDSSGIIARSTDSVTWTSVIAVATTLNYTSLTYDSTQDIYISTLAGSNTSQQDRYILYSVDKGVSWSFANNNIRLEIIRDFIKSNNEYIAAGDPYSVNTTFSTHFAERKTGNFLTYPYDSATQIKTITQPSSLANVDGTYTKTYVRY